ncbi:hypothetical protein BTA51_17120 [Hahella sp. CCB-MM4]|uniref:hypothetical protein n=1 Tax=Hahella sp. (strain CCB-MM4) TaxID=1926491 RepID=UPI000B9A8D3A|nr:hypothetical protein [Hahella sp. CCB-MM4]OZG72088.1 hypothetical protein BTA51_17120 [Hahella sp. CCB-MM4]
MIRQYIERYAEQEAVSLWHDSAGILKEQYDAVLIVPAYAECFADLMRVTEALTKEVDHIRLLQIWVINAPEDADVDHLEQTRHCWNECLQQSHEIASFSNMVLRRFAFGDALLVDRFGEGNQISPRQGVGLARKVGGDCALVLSHSGNIKSGWIHYTDADARLPRDYFQQTTGMGMKCSAAVYAHFHREEGDARQQEAMRRYQLKLDRHVTGLKTAGSPYAYHSIGSTIACRAEAYLKVRGMPARPAGEDFYFLNKLSKIAPVISLDGAAIELSGRISRRVPFGTGPALSSALEVNASRQNVNDITNDITNGIVDTAIVQYHPDIYRLLALLLAQVKVFWHHQLSPEMATESLCKDMQAVIVFHGLDPELPKQWCHEQGLTGRVEGLIRQSANEDAFSRHFHCWFDAFKTLKFIHWWRDQGLKSIPVSSVESDAI